MDRREGKKTGFVPLKQIIFPSVKILSQALLPLSSDFIFLLPFTSIQRGGKASCWLLLSKVGQAKASKGALPRSFLKASLHWRLRGWKRLCLFSCKLRLAEKCHPSTPLNTTQLPCIPSSPFQSHTVLATSFLLSLLLSPLGFQQGAEDRGIF